MNNDLISREALKKVFSDWHNWHTVIGYGKVVFLDKLLEEINNAPTVEPFEPDYVGAERVAARQRGYEEGYHNGMRIGKTLNPKIKQGEWYYNYQNGWHCSICHESVKDMPTVMGKADFNYCPNCGAEMRKGDES